MVWFGPFLDIQELVPTLEKEFLRHLVPLLLILVLIFLHLKEQN